MGMCFMLSPVLGGKARETVRGVCFWNHIIQGRRKTSRILMYKIVSKIWIQIFAPFINRLSNLNLGTLFLKHK